MDTTKSYTVSAYVRLDSSSGIQTVLSQDGNRVSGFFLQIKDGRWAFAVPSGDSNTPGTARAESSSAALAGVWTHLVGVHDGEADELRLYVNGTQAGTAAFASPWSATGSLVFGRGKYQGGSVDFLDGRIDEVRTYGRALTQNEIAELADAVPTGLWLLDDGSGFVAVDSVGSNNGVLGGGASFTGDGLFGGAVGLDGSDDHVDVGAAVVDTTKSYTVSAYVRLDSSSGIQTVLSQDGNRVSGFFLQIKDGRWAFAVPSGDSDSFVAGRASSSSGVLAGVWTHLVGVHDGEADELRLYVNGEQDGTAAFASPWSAAGSLVFGRGKYQGGSVDFLDGRIDEVRTYDRALTSNEIAELYDGNPVPDQDLVYLMAYFTGNSGILERVYYAYSVDALAWNNINAARPVFNAYDDSVRVRDPYMLKVNGKFHLVHTAGWDNKYVFHWESNDGITWSGANGQRNRAAGQINVVPDGNPAPNAWAPEFYWDGEKFYLFWSSRDWDLNGDGQATGDEERVKLFYVTTTDWLSFSAPQLLFDPGFSAIDLNVLSEGGTVYGIYKTEFGIREDRRSLLAKGDSITSLSGTEDILPGVRGVEGPQFLKLIDGSFVLYYDFFTISNRSWGAAESDDLETWTEITPDPDFPADVRHGSILIVTKQEAAAILKEYNTPVPSGWDDVPDVTVSYGAAAYDVDEGSSVTVTVELSTAPKRWVTVPVTLGGTATNNADYSGCPPTSRSAPLKQPPRSSSLLRTTPPTTSTKPSSSASAHSRTGSPPAFAPLRRSPSSPPTRR